MSTKQLNEKEIFNFARRLDSPDAVDEWTRWMRGLTGGFSGWTQATAGGGS